MKKFIAIVAALSLMNTLQAEFKPSIGPELSYRYDFRSSIGLGIHYQWEKDHPFKEGEVSKSHVWIATYEWRYFFSHYTYLSQEISLKYFPYSMELSRRFIKPIGGVAFSYQTNLNEHAIYLTPSIGITDCGVYDFAVGYNFTLTHEQGAPEIFPLQFEFILRPFMIKYMLLKFDK